MVYNHADKYDCGIRWYTSADEVIYVVYDGIHTQAGTIVVYDSIQMKTGI